MNLLDLLIAAPLIGFLITLALPKGNSSLIKMFTLVFSLGVFVASLLLVGPTLDRPAVMTWVTDAPWITTPAIRYHVGMDGVSLWLVLLSTFLTPISILLSWKYIDKRIKEFYAFLLLLEFGLIGVFVSLDLFLFYAFWEVCLVPMYFLIGIWGYEQRIYAAVKFMLYTMAGSVLMLLAIIWIAYYHQTVTGVVSFDLLDLYALEIPAELQMWLFLAFTVAFAIKVPLFPFHTWLPDAHVQAPTAGSVILAGVMLKMGTYGLLRFSFPLFPEAALQFAPYIAILAVIGIVYGALVAMVQPDMKKLVAYSSVSHLGFVVLGLCAMNVTGVQGALFQMLAHGVSTGGLFLIVGMLSERRHTKLIAEYGGLKAVMPKLVAMFLLITLASIALPGMNGFVGEFLIFVGSFAANPGLTAVAVSGVILSAVYMLWMFQRVNYGPLTNPRNKGLRDLSAREWVVIAPIVAMCIGMGVAPGVFLKPMEPAVKRIVAQVRGMVPVNAEMTSGVFSGSAAAEKTPDVSSATAGEGSAR